MSANIAKKLLSTITGAGDDIKSIATLQRALHKALKPQNNEDTYAAAAICILYLSHYKLRFPASKLRVFYTNIKEETTLPLFDCKAYNKILSTIEEGEFNACELLDDKCNIRLTTITKQEIFEALDFYTNQ